MGNLTNWKFQFRHICWLGKRAVIVRWQLHEPAWFGIAYEQVLMHCGRSKVEGAGSASKANGWGGCKRFRLSFHSMTALLVPPTMRAFSQARFGLTHGQLHSALWKLNLRAKEHQSTNCFLRKQSKVLGNSELFWAHFTSYDLEFLYYIFLFLFFWNINVCCCTDSLV